MTERDEALAGQPFEPFTQAELDFWEKLTDIRQGGPYVVGFDPAMTRPGFWQRLREALWR